VKPSGYLRLRDELAAEGVKSGQVRSSQVKPSGYLRLRDELAAEGVRAALRSNDEGRVRANTCGGGDGSRWERDVDRLGLGDGVPEMRWDGMR
jgi:hypothetical protein